MFTAPLRATPPQPCPRACAPARWRAATSGSTGRTGRPVPRAPGRRGPTSYRSSPRLGVRPGAPSWPLERLSPRGPLPERSRGGRGGRLDSGVRSSRRDPYRGSSPPRDTGLPARPRAPLGTPGRVGRVDRGGPVRGVRSLSSRRGAPARGARLTSPRLRVSRRSPPAYPLEAPRLRERSSVSRRGPERSAGRPGRLESPRERASRRSSAPGRPGVARPRGASSRSRAGAPSRPPGERRASPDRYGDVGGRPPAPRPEFWPRRGADGEEGIPTVYGPTLRCAKASRSPTSASQWS